MAAHTNPNPVTFNFVPGTAAAARPLPEFPLSSGDEVLIGPLPGNAISPAQVQVGVGKLAAENGPYTAFSVSTAFQPFSAQRLLSELWVKASSVTDGVQVIIRPFGSQYQPPLSQSKKKDVVFDFGGVGGGGGGAAGGSNTGDSGGAGSGSGEGGGPSEGG
jgi:hypothetical protein